VKSRIAAALYDWARRLTGTGRQPAGLRAQGVAAVLLLVVAGGSGTKLVMHQMDQLPANAAFRSSGEVVTKDQLNQRVKLMEFLYGLREPQDPRRLDQFKRSVAKALVVSGIVDDAARQRGIVVADKAASDQLDKMIKDNSWQDRRKLITELGSRGISEQQVLDEVKRQQSNARLFVDVTKPVKKTTDQAAHAYYDAHKAQMVSPEQRELSNIVVASQQQADQVAQQARSGTDFATLAKQVSIDGSTKDKGGAMGAATKDELDTGYANTAFQAAGGSVFGPVRTPQGWNVGKVGRIAPATSLTFDQVKSAIKTKLDNDAKLKAWNAFLTERIKEADVVYAPDYQPADPDAPPGGAAGS
jgi:peptidyl-prolyl cis-trans isomerase C